MRMILTAACAALLLAGCGTTGPLTGTGSTTSSVSLATADEKALAALELTYSAVLIAVNAAVDSGSLRGERAAQVQVQLRRANAGIVAARGLYARGDAVQASLRLADISSALAAVRGLIGK